MAYILVFEGDMLAVENPEKRACRMLPPRLSEALQVPTLQKWEEMLWEAGKNEELIAELTIGGNSPAGFWVQLVNIAGSN